MKKIAYIELDTHAEIALNFMELMADSDEFSVDYFFSKKILKSLGLQEIPENIKKSSPKYIESQLSNFSYDLVIIGTIHRFFNVFEKIAEQYNTAIICHNLNFVKTSDADLLKSVFKEDTKYRLKLLFKEGLFRKSEVYQKAKNLLVLDESLEKENYKFLPVFFTKEYEKPAKSVFTIVIPGTVSQKRRDYFNSIQKLKDLEIKLRNDDSKTGKKLIEIVFLGKAKSKELFWLKDLERSLEYINLTYFNEKVPQSIFDEYMQKADILWCPVQNETKFFSRKEFYGKTKMSGNLGDAIKYGKSAIFPIDYSATYLFTFKEAEEISEQLFYTKSSFDYDFQEKYSKEKVLDNLEKTLSGFL